MRRLLRALATAALLLLVGAAPATASTVHATILTAGDILGLGHALGGVFGGIGHAVLGAFSWTFALASKFILITVGALVKLLIPRSWAQQGVQIMQWIVAVPNYAGTVTSPTGAHVYGFAGINALRDLFTWLGAGLLPLTLVYATSRAIAGHGDHVAIPIVRVLSLAALLISYPYWWTQGAALVNQITHMILQLGPVLSGLHKLMLYAVDGVALGGWQLIDLALMAAIGIELLALIFLKVAIILLGALLYATGPLTIGLVPTDTGHAITRAWLSAVVALLALPVAWATVFAVGALLINDAGSAAPLIGGANDIGHLLGGALLAIAGLASLWLCLRAAKETAGLLRLQLGGLLSLAASTHASRSTPTAAGAATGSRGAAQSLRSFQSRVSEARGAAIGALAASGPTAARLARAGRTAGGIGRRGVLGSGAASVRAGAGSAAPAMAGVLGRSRAGAVAVQMARAGSASWQTHPQRNTPTPAAPPGIGRPASTPGAAGQTARGSATATPPDAGPDRREPLLIPRPAAPPASPGPQRPAPSPTSPAGGSQSRPPTSRQGPSRNGTPTRSPASSRTPQTPRRKPR